MRAFAHSAAALAAVAAAPPAAAALALRPDWRVGLRERLGDAAARPGCVWVHAASVGEILAALPLVDGLGAAGHDVVTSTQTLAGRAVMRRRRPDVPCGLAPLDHPWPVARALARSRPAALVLVEGELWPCWIAAAARRRTPVVLVSGRISDRSFARRRRVRPLVARTLRRLAAIGARSPRDAERFRALGAPPEAVVVSGDLKLAGDPRRAELAADLAGVLDGTPLVVGGSTHAGEERALLAALTEVEARAIPAALVLAPRRPERAAEVARLVRAGGRCLRRRSALGPQPLRPGEVLLLDSLGELASVYTRADAAFVGGTLVPVGGHNVLEPALAGVPVCYGPHTEHVEAAVGILERSGAGRRVADAVALADALGELLSHRAAAGAPRGRGVRIERGDAVGTAMALVERAVAGASAESGA
jgi:3-deoxy-D-manno-octulosonic-acid transferase